ncbi:MAG: RluA family pseudouridine synthase [Clostridiales bacterium]|nr:RluA family pseudouridine synthase [Clostridiales bacterium]
MERLNVIVSPELDGKRADAALSELTGRTRSQIQGFLEDGLATADGRPLQKNTRVRAGQRLELELPDPVELEAVPQNIPVDIVYEDDQLLVVNKPKGMVVHPAPGNPDGTLVNALLWHCQGGLSSINGVIRPGIVHRIDRDTSGLLLVAKTDLAHQSLSAQIKAHSCDRVYQAVVYGRFREGEGTVSAPIGRNPNERKEMCVTTRNSREAVTHYRVLAEYEGFSHLELRLETGRTHQIRVHMAYLGHPVAGDPVYGPRRVISSLGGQCLHAKAIAFDHPVTGERMQFDSPLPGYFTDFIRTLRPL